jgi:hypothetical protein
VIGASFTVFTIQFGCYPVARTRPNMRIRGLHLEKGLHRNQPEIKKIALTGSMLKRSKRAEFKIPKKSCVFLH